MEDRKITERESLEVITSMIAQTKQRYIGNGNILLMWGYLVAIITILVWILCATTQQGAWNWLWLTIPLIGFTVDPVMARRQKRDYGVVTYSDKITTRLWSIFGVSEIILILMCLGFQFVGEIYCWQVMFAYTLIAAPVAEIAQGLIIKEKALVIGACVALAIGLVTNCCIAGDIPLNANWFLPLFILSFVAMMIVPGHILNYKARHR